MEKLRVTFQRIETITVDLSNPEPVQKVRIEGWANWGMCGGDSLAYILAKQPDSVVSHKRGDWEAIESVPPFAPSDEEVQAINKRERRRAARNKRKAAVHPLRVVSIALLSLFLLGGCDKPYSAGGNTMTKADFEYLEGIALRALNKVERLCARVGEERCR